MSTADEEPVPRLPRGRGMRFSRAQLMRIAMTAILLAMVIVVARPCASSVSTFVTGFDDGSGSAAKGSASYMPRPGSVDEPGTLPKEYEQIRPDMTPEEMRAAVERARARARASSAGSAGSGSAGSGSAGSGSGSGSAPAR